MNGDGTKLLEKTLQQFILVKFCQLSCKERIFQYFRYFTKKRKNDQNQKTRQKKSQRSEKLLIK